MTMGKLASLAAAMFAAAPAPATEPEPVIHSAEIAAPVGQVWTALTTAEGVRGFFAGEARVEPRIGGAYEVYFIRENPAGLRGSEGARILAMEPPSRLLISWNAPVRFGPLRDQYTVVEFALTPLGVNRSRLDLGHFGWGDGEPWQAVRDYFDKAWPSVLGLLQYRFERGPVDWTAAPDAAAYFTPALSELTRLTPADERD